jgi:DNA repair ATPase RecN
LFIILQADRLKDKYETEIFELKRDYEDRIDTLNARLEKTENELSNLDSYRRDKDSHDRKLSDVENELQSEKAKAVIQLEEQER